MDTCFELSLANFFLSIVLTVLLVVLLRLTYVKRRQEIDLQKQLLILIELTKQVVHENSSTQKGAQRLVGMIPQRVATAVEKVVMDNEARRSDSDLPRAKPISHEKKSHE